MRKLLLAWVFSAISVQALRVHSDSFAEGEQSELYLQESAAKVRPWQALVALLLAYSPSPSEAFTLGPGAPHTGFRHGLSGAVRRGTAFTRPVGRRVRQPLMMLPEDNRFLGLEGDDNFVAPGNQSVFWNVEWSDELAELVLRQMVLAFAEGSTGADAAFSQEVKERLDRLVAATPKELSEGRWSFRKEDWLPGAFGKTVELSEPLRKLAALSRQMEALEDATYGDVEEEFPTTVAVIRSQIRKWARTEMPLQAGSPT